MKRIKKIIVQAEWIKKEFSKKFNYDLENIVVMKPEVKIINIENVKIIPKDKFRIFYPATPLIYKNHKLIIETLGKIKKENQNLVNKLECIFTFSKGDNIELDNLIKRNNLEDVVKLIGKISYEEVLSYYRSSDLMIFPSYIETLGLPLLEAQYFDLEILAMDLPYSREVIGEYKKVKYFSNEEELYQILKFFYSNIK